MVALQRTGLSVDVPKGWDARLTTRPPVPGTGIAADAVEPSLLHAASFPLPNGVGDFGSNAVEEMSTTDAFVTLFEHEPSSANTGLFAHVGLPEAFVAADFDEHALQRPQAGQVGLQRFFTLGERAFCVYVVLGHRAMSLRKLPVINQLVASIRLD